MKAHAPVVTVVFALLYWTLITLQGSVNQVKYAENAPKVIIAAPVQVLMYFGDRFLAGNIEAVRAIVSTPTISTQQYRQQAHLLVSQLHPCHEDNYWIGNVSLSWGGAMNQGLDILSTASGCRFWDEWPPFFYAFNQNFFMQDVDEARRVLEIAAQRSAEAAPTFRTYSTMLAVGKVDTLGMALSMLEKEMNATSDASLKEMLNKRYLRLQGLITLREAQSLFEEKISRPLKDPQELLDYNLLSSYPEDPMKIGYEFRNNQFHLRQIKVQ